MISYEIEALPTVYQGQRFRSRLEAKWAAFFDILGWPYEYEPVDLGSWSPDFLIKGRPRPILCEVKPITQIDVSVTEKMCGAANTASFRGELLLLGASPFDLIPPPESPSQEGWLGWLEDRGQWKDGAAGDFPFTPTGFVACAYVNAPGDLHDFCDSINSYHGRITGAWDGDHYVTLLDDRVRSAWREANSAVQWRPKR